MAAKRILIVHDDAAFVEQLTSNVRSMGVDMVIDAVLSAPRALGAIEQALPDVVVVDAELVGTDGYQLTQQIKSSPVSKDVPVVIVSLSPDEASALKARSVGAAAHMAAAGPIDNIGRKVVALAGATGAPAGTPMAPVPGTPVSASSGVAQPMGVQTPASTPATAPTPRPVIGAASAPTAAPAAASAPMGAVPASAPGQPSAQPAVPAGYGAPQPVNAAGGVPSAVGMSAPAGVTPAQVPATPPTAVRPAPSTPAAATTVPGAGSYGAPQPAPTGSPRVVADAAAALEPPHIDDLLRTMLQRGGSDLHITVGAAPGIRLRGEITPIEEMHPLTPRDTQEMILSLLSEEQRRRFETELELDFAYSIPGVARFRANIFQQRNSMGAVFRVIPIKIPTLEELGMPKVCQFLAERPRGLVLVTGPTGSGKSTTLAAMIDHINANRSAHIITLEDPIEFMHRNKRSFINQREIGEDTHSFTAALKRVLRQDPDVILVGEMRDLETISAAITAAETGHLVLATLHTTGGPETIDRVVDVFPPHQQQQVRMQLSSSLEGVLSQVLLRSTDGRSRIMAMEIMLGIPAISNLIREGKTHQMDTIIQGGAQLGMQTLDQHLKNLLSRGKITYEEAISKAKNPRDLAAMLGKKL